MRLSGLLAYVKQNFYSKWQQSEKHLLFYKFTICIWRLLNILGSYKVLSALTKYSYILPSTLSSHSLLTVLTKYSKIVPSTLGF